MKKIVLSLAIVSVSFFSNIVPSSAEKPNPIEIIDVSLVQLIARGESYNGKIVEVQGYLHQKFEDNALYLSKEDGDYLNCRNAIWVAFDKNAKISIPEKGGLDCQHVILVGTFSFSKDGNGHKGMYAGELKEVSKGTVISKKSTVPADKP